MYVKSTRLVWISINTRVILASNKLNIMNVETQAAGALGIMANQQETSWVSHNRISYSCTTFSGYYILYFSNVKRI